MRRLGACTRVARLNLFARPCARVCTVEADFAETPGEDGLYAVTDGDIQARILRQTDELMLFAKHLGALRAEKAARPV